jgi:hypothetical protein
MTERPLDFLLSEMGTPMLVSMLKAVQMNLQTMIERPTDHPGYAILMQERRELIQFLSARLLDRKRGLEHVLASGDFSEGCAKVAAQMIAELGETLS